MDTPIDVLYSLARILLWSVLPWTLGVLGACLALSATPFGQGLIDALKNRRRDTDLLEAMLQELTELRHGMGEVVERLDSAERRLMQERALPPAAGPERIGPASERVATPH